MKLENKLKLYIEANVPVMLWGNPGVGKTASVVTTAVVNNWDVDVIIASLREPTDFLGLPFPTGDGTTVRFLRPAELQRLIDAPADKLKIVFLDELTTAPLSTQAALLRLVHERAVDGTKLSPSVRFVAAGNFSDTAAGSGELAPALRNRFAHVNVKIDPVDWSENFPTYWGHDFDGERVKARAIVAGYIRHNPSALMTWNAEKNPLVFASPRSWEAVTKLIVTVWRWGSSVPDIADEICENVGDEGLGFVNWAQALDLPDPRDILDKPDILKTDWRGDILFTAVMAVLGHVTDAESWKRAWRVAKHIFDAGRHDVGVIFASRLAKARQSGWEITQEFRDIVPFLREIGI